ncbi:hypothetical protein ACFYQ5_10645 [Streptomyces sp. NPDC005794]|uniref:hypothetical protein n=1 Tax=Streptomyces sp. NPDC005794 TaxID=3364733 RepID=UPI0036BDF19D
MLSPTFTAFEPGNTLTWCVLGVGGRHGTPVDDLDLRTHAGRGGAPSARRPGPQLVGR